MSKPKAPRPVDPWHAALRRTVVRAEEMRRLMPEVPPRMQFELRRKLIHVLAAILAVPVLLLLPLTLAILIAAVGLGVIVSTWLIDRWRLQKFLLSPYKDLVHEPVAEALAKTRRPGEDFPWSPVLYTASLILIALAHHLLGMSWTIAFAAYAILGLGDTASAIVGIAYGRTKLPWNPKKSFEGTTAGVVAGFMGGIGMASVAFAFAGAAIPVLFLGIVFIGAVAGALSETIPRVEDNFVVPITAAGVMYALSLLLAVPLP